MTGTTGVGAGVGAVGVTGSDGALEPETPSEFAAVTVNVYGWPFVSPPNSHDGLAAVTWHVTASNVDVIV